MLSASLVRCCKSKTGLAQLMSILPNTPDEERSGVDKNGDTMLTLVSKYGTAEMLQYLLDNDVDDLFETGENGKTPLLAACSGKGNLKKLKILIDNDANINVKDDNGDNCLTLAAGDGDRQMLEFLVENGADINKKGADDRTALLSACCTSGNLENLRYILKETNANKKAKDSDGDNCMTLVAEFGDFLMFTLCPQCSLGT